MPFGISFKLFLCPNLDRIQNGSDKVSRGRLRWQKKSFLETKSCTLQKTTIIKYDLVKKLQIRAKKNILIWQGKWFPTND